MKPNQENQKKSSISEQELQKEIDFLRMENDYLKKLNALVQNKEKSTKKTEHK